MSEWMAVVVVVAFWLWTLRAAYLVGRQEKSRGNGKPRTWL